MLRRIAATLAALVLGAGGAFGVAACGEDRGSVEVEGGAGTGKTGATVKTGGATTGGTVPTGQSTAPRTTTPEQAPTGRTAPSLTGTVPTR